MIINESKLTIYKTEKEDGNLMASDDRKKSEKKKFILLAEIAALKKVTQIVAKRLPQMCTTVQLWVGKGEGSFSMR
jgi:hypothetical protein